MKPVEIEVGGTTFYITRMDAFDALAAFGDLQKDVLPSVGGMIAAIAEGDLTDESADVAIADAITKLSTQLDGKQLKYWCDRLLAKERVSVEINGNVMPLDAVARPMAFTEFTDILELLFHVIKLEFGGPLASWLGRLGLDPSQLTAGLSERTATKSPLNS